MSDAMAAKLEDAGKGDWITPRSDRIVAKGKGTCRKECRRVSLIVYFVSRPILVFLNLFSRWSRGDANILAHDDAW